MTNLETITSRFGKRYWRSKKNAELAAKSQAQFMAACTEALEHTNLAQRLIEIDDSLEFVDAQFNPEEWVAINYPGWRYLDHTGDHILVEEDPALLKYTYVNKRDGWVYGRTYIEDGPSLDAERLQEENPDLWKEITEWPNPWYSLVKVALEEWCPDAPNTNLENYLDQYLPTQGVQRVLRPLDTWTEDQDDATAKYMTPGAIKTRLVAPRKAKPEELECE